MITKIKKIRKIKFIKYVFFSAITSLINIIVYFLVHTFIIKNIYICNLFAYSVSITISFILNKKVVFNNASKKVIKQLGLYLSIKVLSLSLDSLVLTILYENLSVNHELSKIVSNASTGILNYFMNKKVVFKVKKTYNTPI